MKNSQFNINDLNNAIDKYKYIVGELRNSHGDKMIQGHKSSTKVKTWIKQTLEPFTKRPNKDGMYYVYFWSDPNKKTDPDIYPMIIGNPSNLDANNPMKATVIHNHIKADKKLSEDNNPLNWESAMAYLSQISDLKAENAQLKLKVERLEDKLEEQKENLSEAPRDESFFKDLVPMFDSFMQDRAQQRYFEMMRSGMNPSMFNGMPGMNMQGMPGMQPGMNMQQMFQAVKQQPNQNNSNAELNKINAFIADEKLVSDEEHTFLCACRDKNKNMQAFLQALYSENPELYQRMYEFVYGKEAQA